MSRSDSDAWRGTVDVGDCRIYVAVDGLHGAPHLMLSNSLGSDLSMWDPQLAAFAERFRVIRYDFVVTANQERRTAPTQWIDWGGTRSGSSIISRSKRRTGAACRWAEWLANGLEPMRPLALTS